MWHRSRLRLAALLAAGLLAMHLVAVVAAMLLTAGTALPFEPPVLHRLFVALSGG